METSKTKFQTAIEEKKNGRGLEKHDGRCSHAQENSSGPDIVLVRRHSLLLRDLQQQLRVANQASENLLSGWLASC